MVYSLLPNVNTDLFLVVHPAIPFQLVVALMVLVDPSVVRLILVEVVSYQDVHSQNVAMENYFVQSSEEIRGSLKLVVVLLVVVLLVVDLWVVDQWVVILETSVAENHKACLVRLPLVVDHQAVVVVVVVD